MPYLHRIISVNYRQTLRQQSSNRLVGYEIHFASCKLTKRVFFDAEFHEESESAITFVPINNRRRAQILNFWNSLFVNFPLRTLTYYERNVARFISSGLMTFPTSFEYRFGAKETVSHANCETITYFTMQLLHKPHRNHKKYAVVFFYMISRVSIKSPRVVIYFWIINKTAFWNNRVERTASEPLWKV